LYGLSFPQTLTCIPNFLAIDWDLSHSY
jgi:hypothetical protein